MCDVCYQSLTCVLTLTALLILYIFALKHNHSPIDTTHLENDQWYLSYTLNKT